MRRNNISLEAKRHARFVGGELLEKRELLHSGNIAWVETSQLDLSFAPDGVDIAGEPNALFSTFDEKFGEGEWQETILRAFQTWAVHTNANIGLADEQGSNAFGTPGPRVGDERFGDIRVGARSLDSGSLAVAISQDTLVSGTWAGDVIFNSHGDFESLDELFSVALHEAGHVLGLTHSENPESPMHVHGVSEFTELLDEDVESLIAIYGERERDEFEGRSGNNRASTASTIRTNNWSGRHDGSAPSIILADITSLSDVDFFRIRAPDDYTGTVTIQVRSDGVSMLSPSVTIGDNDASVIYKSLDNQIGGTIQAADIEWREGLFVRVASERDDVFAIGSYSLTVTYDQIDEVDDAVVEELTGGRYSGLDNDDTRSYLESGDRRSFRNDRHSDDDSDSANEFTRQRTSDQVSSLKAVGSLTDQDDVDYFRFESPNRYFARQTTGFVSVRSLEFGTLVPEIELFDERGRSYDYEILVNGNGELMVQLPDLASDTELRLRVSGGGSIPEFRQGNYELNVFFMNDEIALNDFASGSVSKESVATHQLHVATPQIFHFALTANSVSVSQDSQSGVMLNLLDESQIVVHRIVAPEGTTRTAGSVLLLPGVYTLQAVPLRSQGVPDDHELSFSLRGAEISDPFGIDVILPDDTEYECDDNVGGDFCFPDGTQSTIPFDWDDFIYDFGDLDFSDAEVNDLILAGWWSSYFASSEAISPPTAVSESYTVDANRVLSVPASEGLLANDVSESNIVAAIYRFPANGEIAITLDGGFTYTPAAGFTGVDSFEYTASNLRSLSTPTIVQIGVGTDIVKGDLDGSGTVDSIDIDLLAAAVESGTNTHFDLNADGHLDVQDHHFLVYDILGTTFGDSNLDGRFDSSDFVIAFQGSQFEKSNEFRVGWQLGDWNGDGKFNSTDFVVAFQTGRYAAAAAAIDVLYDTVDGSSIRRTFIQSAVV
ncbi:Ig-like domain-containing protein [Planctomycetota bacterium]